MLITLILTFFLDNIGLFMVVPIYAPLLLNPHDTMLAATISYHWRTVLIGSLVASYGVGQLLGGPILGELSDQFGRKKILLLGLVCLVVGNVLGAYSLIASQLWLLFVGRLLTGFASGNWSVIFAAVTDMAPEETRRNVYLGYLTGAAAIGAIVGPLVGAYLSNPKIMSWFSYATPFFIMASIFVFNFLLVVITMRETNHFERRPLQLFTGVKNVIDCFKMPIINSMLIAFFFFSMSSESIFAGLPIFVVEKFNMSSSFIGNLIAVGSLVSVFSSFYLNRKLSTWLSTEKTLLINLIILCIAYVSFFIPSNANGLFFSYGLFGLSVILVWTYANALLTKHVAENVRGKVLGVNQSLCSLAIIVGPFLIGIGAAAHYNLPISISLISGLISLCLYAFLIGFKIRKKIS